MKRTAIAVLLLTVTALLQVSAQMYHDEVWVLDQRNSVNTTGGGYLHIYDSRHITGGVNASSAVPILTIDLGKEARNLCINRTSSGPVRPHMLLTNPAGTHGILSNVASGHVMFINLMNRTFLDCIDVGVQAHAAFSTPDSRYVIVANQGGGLLQRISTDYTTNTFILEPQATINLNSTTNCTTSSGRPCQDNVLRPDNAPICPVMESTSRYTFITLRGGGLFVVDITTNPMKIVADYDNTVIQGAGCGGIQANGTVYLNSGALGSRPGGFIYSIELADIIGQNITEPNMPNITIVYTETGPSDSHGALPINDYIWFVDRVSDKVVIVDSRNKTAVNFFQLNGTLSIGPTADQLDLSSDKAFVFASLRGPNPLSGSHATIGTNRGASPGVGIIQVLDNGLNGQLIGIAPINSTNTTDPHGIRVYRFATDAPSTSASSSSSGSVPVITAVSPTDDSVNNSFGSSLQIPVFGTFVLLVLWTVISVVTA